MKTNHFLPTGQVNSDSSVTTVLPLPAFPVEITEKQPDQNTTWKIWLVRQDRKFYSDFMNECIRLFQLGGTAKQRHCPHSPIRRGLASLARERNTLY